MNHLGSLNKYTDAPVLIIIMSSKTFQATILIISFIAKISIRIKKQQSALLIQCETL